MAKKKYKIEHCMNVLGYALQLKGMRNFLARRALGPKHYDEIVWTNRLEKVKVFATQSEAENEAKLCTVHGCNCEVVAVNFERMVEDKPKGEDDDGW